MSHIPNNPSASFRRRNPHLYPPEMFHPVDGSLVHGVATGKQPGAIIVRQSAKPTLNKTETAFRDCLKLMNPDGFITEQAITFRLANGVRYTPDFVVFNPLAGTVDAFEVKAFMRDDAAVKIKVAASVYPFIKWTLAWRQKGDWKIQHVKA